MSVTTRARVAPGTWAHDPVHSSIGFSVRHMVVATYRSRFDDFETRLEVPEQGEPRLEGVVRAESIEAKDPNLAAHLRAEDFFDTERFPEIRFTSTAFRIDGDRVEVTGRLTIKDHTEEVTGRGTFVGPTTDPFGREKLGLRLDTTVDRRAFGLTWNAPLPKGGFALADEVTLEIELELGQEG
jgi:polyisoprenoid-binding protein YceI